MTSKICCRREREAPDDARLATAIANVSDDSKNVLRLEAGELMNEVWYVAKTSGDIRVATEQTVMK
jgi:hypothetical protein